MRSLLLLIGLLASAGLYGQAPYTGGEGDGYAHRRLELRSNGATPAYTATVRVDGDQPQLYVQLTGISESARVEAYDVAGRRLLEWEAPGTGEQVYQPALEFPAQVLVLRVTIDGEEFRRKLFVPTSNQR